MLLSYSCLLWQNLLNPDFIEAAINSRSTSKIPVPVYKNTCDNEKIRKVANSHGLKVICGSAHEFNVKIDNKHT